MATRLRPIPLWDHWSEERLRARAAEGERAFERGFRLRAISDSERTFAAYSRCRVPGVRAADMVQADWPTFTGVDLSGKKRPGNAIITIALDPRTGRRYPVDVRFGAWQSNETCDNLAAVDERWRPRVIVVENNGYQNALIEWAKATTRGEFWTKIEAWRTDGGNKYDEAFGLPSLQVEFNNQAWVFPLLEWEGATPQDNNSAGFWARLDYELRNHPVAATSDGVMALWFARQGLELYGGRRASGFDSVGSLGDLTAR